MADKEKDLITRAKNVFMSTYKPYPIVLEKGEGVYLYDNKGKKYLDFGAGIAVNALGYGQRHHKDGLQDQLSKGLLHCSNLYYNEPSIQAAEKLVEISGLDKVFFSNSGAESVEGALKLARKYGKAYKHPKATQVISMKNSFHGRTYGAVTLTGQEKYQKDLEPMVPEVFYSDFNDLQALETMVNKNTCAIIVELIQGEGGIIKAEKDFIQKVRKLCDQENILLIFDEIQTGIGRTGEWFAYQHYGVLPDILTLAKGLGGGVPVGALLAKDKVAQAFNPGDHASTYGGNPLVTTAVCKVLETIEKQELLVHVKECSEYVTYLLTKMMQQVNGSLEQQLCQEVRGKGLLLGLKIEGKREAVIQLAMEKGLLLVPAGKDIIRIIPPLTISLAELDEGISILEDALQEVHR